MLNFRNAIIMSSLLSVVACGGPQRVTDKTIFDESKPEAKRGRNLEDTEIYQRAYQDGVREVLQDIKGKMQASKDFVYDPAVVECGIKVPARVVGGILIPEHEECVLMRKGGFKETSPVYLPVIGE